MSQEKERFDSSVQISVSLQAQQHSNYTFDTAVALHVLNGLNMPNGPDVQIVGKLDNTRVHEAITERGVTYHSLYALPERDPRDFNDELIRTKANRIAVEGLFAVAKHHSVEGASANNLRDQIESKQQQQRTLKKWAATAGAFGFLGLNGYFTKLGANTAEIPYASVPLIAGVGAMSAIVLRQYYEIVDRKQQEAATDATERYNTRIDLCARNNTVLVLRD